MFIDIYFFVIYKKKFYYYIIIMFKKILIFIIIITFTNFIINHLNGINSLTNKKKTQNNNVNLNDKITTELSTDIENYIDETINKYDVPYVKDNDITNNIKNMINIEEQKKYINGLSSILQEQKSTNAGVPTNFNPNLENQNIIKNNMDNRIVQKKDIFISNKNINIDAINEENNFASF